MFLDPRGVLLTQTWQILAAGALAVAWCITEYLGRTSTWRQGAPKQPKTGLDKGTYPAIAAALSISLLFSAAAFLLSLGPALPALVALLGLVVGLTGLSLRLWAMRTLGRFFTMPITLDPQHRLVQDGPYRWIRHPSYTGNFLAALGMSIIFGTAVGILVTLVLCFGIYAHRIRVEEATLAGHFGPTYQTYRAGTSRLLPKIY